MWATVALSAWGQVWAQEMPVIEIGERPVIRMPGGAILIPTAGLDGIGTDGVGSGWPAATLEGIDSFEYYRHGHPSVLDDSGGQLPEGGPAWTANGRCPGTDGGREPAIVPEPTAVLFLAIGAVLLAMKRTGLRSYSRPA
jgi:hypothetical protein